MLSVIVRIFMLKRSWIIIDLALKGHLENLGVLE